MEFNRFAFYLTIYIELYGPLGFVEVLTPTPQFESRNAALVFTLEYNLAVPLFPFMS